MELSYWMEHSIGGAVTTDGRGMTTENGENYMNVCGREATGSGC